MSGDGDNMCLPISEDGEPQRQSQAKPIRK